VDTLEQQLDRVQKAIAAIESGAQEYGVGSRRVTKGDLKTLYDREAKLKQELSLESVGSTRAYAYWPTR